MLIVVQNRIQFSKKQNATELGFTFNIMNKRVRSMNNTTLYYGQCDLSIHLSVNLEVSNTVLTYENCIKIQLQYALLHCAVINPLCEKPVTLCGQNMYYIM